LLENKVMSAAKSLLVILVVAFINISNPLFLLRVM
jgi:hypothetical protein